MAWDDDGDYLALSADQNSKITLWDTTLNRSEDLDVGFKESICCLAWSPSKLIAIGSSKGNFQIYNVKRRSKLPAAIAKHSKKITCATWSTDDRLALGSDDKSISISDSKGDYISQIALRDIPSDIKFANMKTEERTNTIQQNTISAIIGKETFLLFDLTNPDNPVELAFQKKYGKLVDYHWYGDGYVLIGFSNGYIIVISTHSKEIGQEMYQTRSHRSLVSCIDKCHNVFKVAIAGDNSVKVIDLNDVKETECIVTIDEEKGSDRGAASTAEISRVRWSDDGQLLAIGTKSGSLHVFLAKLPSLGDSFGTRIALLSSLLEVSLINNVMQEPRVSIRLEVEPNFIFLGPYYMATGMNNRVYFYEILNPGGDIGVFDREYAGTVKAVCLNERYVAVLHSNKVQLQLIGTDGAEQEHQTSEMFPLNNSDGHVKHAALTTDFLIYCTSNGNLHYFYIDDWTEVGTFQHNKPIKTIYPDFVGTSLIFIDETGHPFLYNSFQETVVDIPDPPKSIATCLWDNYDTDKRVFVICNDKVISTYAYIKHSIRDMHCVRCGVTKLQYGYHPLMLYNGVLSCQAPSGMLVDVPLESHPIFYDDSTDISKLKEVTLGLVNMQKYRMAFQMCKSINDPDLFEECGKKTLSHLALEDCMQYFREAGDVAMLMSIAQLQNCEDKRLMSGHAACFLNEFDLAQEHYLASSKPKCALEMRKDLLEWETALTLAQTLAPQDIPYISKQYADQLEFVGDYMGALASYEAGLKSADGSGEHEAACAAGVARCALRVGDIKRGVGIAYNHPSRQLKKECAAILESMKQLVESAQLYEKAAFYDRAAAVYIKCKNWSKVGELLPHITSTKIHLQYGKAKEQEGKYREAVQAYTAAKDFDSVIRVNLDYIHNPEEAIRVVRETNSIDGAKMVAKFFVGLSDIETALQFLVMSKCHDQAFQLARDHHHMTSYASLIGDDANDDDYISVAVHFEKEKNHLLAGKFFYKCRQYQRSMKHLLRCTPTPEQENDPEMNSILIAIKAVGEANDDLLTHQLIEYLMGEYDGGAKDARYLFKLYMALHRYQEAARTAIIIAREEQQAGNYRIAHDVLFGMFSDLRTNNIKIPQEMTKNLMLLHSYLLVRLHNKRGDHLKAARLLVRVASNISKFPQHVVAILTSTVVECYRSGLKGSAFDYASMLLRPEYHNKIDSKYKSRVEHIVKKRDRAEIDDHVSPCPYCNFELPNYDLVCSECKNTLPYCIVTGMHMVKEDWTCCTHENCQFPGLLSEFQNCLEVDQSCPMCQQKIVPHDLRKYSDDEVRKLLAMPENDNTL